jgi:hypothetical protein
LLENVLNGLTGEFCCWWSTVWKAFFSVLDNLVTLVHQINIHM